MKIYAILILERIFLKSFFFSFIFLNLTLISILSSDSKAFKTSKEWKAVQPSSALKKFKTSHKKYKISSLFQIKTFRSSRFNSKKNSYKKLSKRIDRLIKESLLPKESLSLMITNSRGFRYVLNEKKLFNGASLVKIFIAAACFSLFPKDHRFKTELFIDSQKKRTAEEFYILEGNLYLKGGGDPGFTSESLWNLVNQFKRERIVKITGDIFVDSTLFDNKMYEGRRKVRVESSYDAPIHALSFNWNTVNIFVRPSKVLGERALVFVDPSNEYIKVINKSQTRRGSKNKIRVRRMRNLHRFGDSIYVEGTLGIRAKEKIFYRNITQPALWTGYNLKNFLEQRNIKVLGQVKEGTLPKNLKLVSTQKSLPLKKSISDMMKFSNNFVAEMLTKNLSLQDGASQGSLKGGLLKIKEFLKDLSFLEKNYVLLSPSGLSQKNRFRIQDIHKILEIVKEDFRIFPDFLSTLPINAIDGTLKDRVNDDPHVEAWIRAKTGTLNHVAGLAGYAGTKNGPPFTFAFLFNSPSEYSPTSVKARKLRQKGELLWDKISKSLVTF